MLLLSIRLRSAPIPCVTELNTRLKADAIGKVELNDGDDPKFVGALDVRNQCSGFLYGLHVATGLVKSGSVVKKADGEIDFLVADRHAVSPVTFKGELPDLFREGQGVVAIGAYDAAGVFVATQILAKHDEKYMPPQLAAALKKDGEWRGDGATPTYDQPGAAP